MAMLEEVRKALKPTDDQAKEQMDFLHKAAIGQLERFELQFREKLTNPAAFRGEILPKDMIEQFKFHRVNIRESSSDEVGNVVNSFLTAEPKIMDGFKEMAKLALNTVLGNMTIGEERTERWFVTMEFGALIRVDLMAWRYGFSGSGVISTVKDAFCFIVIKSFADIENLNRNQLGYFIARSLQLPGIEQIMASEILRTYLTELTLQIDEMRGKRPEDYVRSRSAAPAMRRRRLQYDEHKSLL